MGPFIWDVKRLVASINLIMYSKAFSDEKIAKIIGFLVQSYLMQIHALCRAHDSSHVSITSENTRGSVNKLLKESRLGSKEAHLDTMTVVENYERKFLRSDTMRDVDDQLRHDVLLAYQDYLRTIPESKRGDGRSYQVALLPDDRLVLQLVLASV